MRYALLCLMLISLLPLAASPAAAQSGVNTHIDVMLVLDNSGSMNDNDPQNLRTSAARLFINLLAEGDQVGVVAMANRDTTRAKLSLTAITDNAQIADAAFRDADELSNWTYMGEALDLASGALDSAAVHNPQRAVILLTDGLPTYEDPDRAAQEAKFGAAVERLKADGVKIFPIALGDAADVGFLDSALATPTGGRTWKAQQAAQLLQVYIEILAMLQDGRYVDRYQVLGNVETFLADVNPRQQIRQANFVFPAIDAPPPEIVDLKLPRAFVNSRDELSQVNDPGWTMWTARPEYIDGFNGEWRVSLATSQARVPVAAVLKSDLRTRLIEPSPSLPADDVAVRYYPAGRPVLLRAGARNASDRLEKRIGLWAREPQPGRCSDVTQSDNEWEGAALTDEGDLQDVQPVDGEYAGLMAQPLAPGSYCLMVNVSSNGSHLRLDKPYDLVVEPLPTMEVEVAPKERLAVGEPIKLTARFGLDGQPATVDSAEISAVVKRDDRVLSTVRLQPQDDGTWQGEYLPAEMGAYAFGLTAHVSWNAPDRGPRRYTDYAEASYSAQKQRVVEVGLAAGAPPAERVNTLRDGIQRTLQLRSYSDQPVELALDVAGVPEGEIYPATLVLQPGESVNRTVTISSRAGLGSGDYKAEIQVSGADEVQLSTTTLPLQFTVNGWLARSRWLLALLLLIGALLCVPSVRRGLAESIGRNLELLRYGGR